MNNLVKTSYAKEDVTFLLKDITGLVKPISTKKREKLNQSGVHYSEMLPLEYKPTEIYMEIYHESLQKLSLATANATALLAEKLYQKFQKPFVIVSLARAGTPIGILLKRYMKQRYHMDLPHYSISIIRGKGIDINAVKYIIEKHNASSIQFVDGWIGKGAINRVLKEACDTLKQSSDQYLELDDSLAVLSDPAFETELCGTHEDFLIPSACLNSTVSGLVSRTFLRDDIIGENDFHGAVYYGELEKEDRSNEFIDTVTSHFDDVEENFFKEKFSAQKGMDEVKKIASDFGIQDINKIKPGVGEATRVLLRRLPAKILVRSLKDRDKYPHIFRLCEEKKIPIEEYPLKMYGVCGLIKVISN